MCVVPRKSSHIISSLYYNIIFKPAAQFLSFMKALFMLALLLRVQKVCDNTTNKNVS